jgi:hypothetical protein
MNDKTPPPDHSQFLEVRALGLTAMREKLETRRKSIVRQNAEADSSYRPFCLRCSSWKRMEIIEPMLWRCACGAEHDERDSNDSSHEEI